jgi:hypothetical protein
LVSPAAIAATPGTIEITPRTTLKITPTSIATSLGTPDLATTTPNATTGLETISLNKEECTDSRHPDVFIVAWVSPDAASALARLRQAAVFVN